MKTLSERALEFALKAHGDQQYGDKPYKYHLQSVAETVSQFDFSEHHIDRIVIAYLHDVLEDTDVC